jgi:hypothetical protein
MTAMGIIVAVGIALVVSCIALLFLPYGDKFKGRKEHFSGFGISLDISMLAALGLVGAVMTVVPAAFPLYGEYRHFTEQLQETQHQLEASRNQAAQLQQELERSQKFDIWALVSLEGVTERTRPKPSDIECTYLAFGDHEPVKAAAVTYGVRGDQYRILLGGIDRKTVLQRLVIDEPATKRRWVFENLMVPLEPQLQLKKEKES